MAEEQTKKKRMGTIENMKTAMTTRLRSKPLVEGQEYLNLWSLKRDRARWGRAKTQAEEKLKNIDEMIQKIHLPEENPPAPGDGRDEAPVTRSIQFSTCQTAKPERLF